MFQDKVAVVTGGAQGIGRCICEEFAKQGAKVCTIDLLENDFFQGDVGKKEDLEQFAQKVIQTYGRVDFLVNNAKPLFLGIDTCTWEQFNQALQVGVAAPFYLTQLLLPYLGKGASIVNISS